MGVQWGAGQVMTMGNYSSTGSQRGIEGGWKGIKLKTPNGLIAFLLSFSPSFRTVSPRREFLRDPFDLHADGDYGTLGDLMSEVDPDWGRLRGGGRGGKGHRLLLVLLLLLLLLTKMSQLKIVTTFSSSSPPLPTLGPSLFTAPSVLWTFSSSFFPP